LSHEPTAVSFSRETTQSGIAGIKKIPSLLMGKGQGGGDVGDYFPVSLCMRSDGKILNMLKGCAQIHKTKAQGGNYEKNVHFNGDYSPDWVHGRERRGYEVGRGVQFLCPLRRGPSDP
jgi:hypothetical protein